MRCPPCVFALLSMLTMLILFFASIVYADNLNDQQTTRLETLRTSARWMVPIISAKWCHHIDELHGMTKLNLGLLRRGQSTFDIQDTLEKVRNDEDQLKLFKAKPRKCRDPIVLRLISCLPELNGGFEPEDMGSRCLKEPILTYIEIDTGKAPSVPVFTEYEEISPHSSIQAEEQKNPKVSPALAPAPVQKPGMVCTPRRGGGETCKYVEPEKKAEE